MWSEFLMPEMSEAARERWVQRRQDAEEKPISSRVGVAPHLLVHDGEAVEKLLEVERLMRKVRSERYEDERAPLVAESLRRVQALAGEIQRRLDELLGDM